MNISSEVGHYDDVVSTVLPLQDNIDMKNIALQALGGRSSVSGIRATVFGGSSITGRALINMLGQIGSQIVVPYRGDGRDIRSIKMMGDLGQVIPLPFHVRDERTVRRAIEGSNVVINLLGAIKQRETWNFTYHDIHVNAAHLIAKTSMDLGVDRFIQVSSLPAAPDALCEFDRTKWHGEQIVKQYYPEATIIRPSLIFGHHDRFVYKMVLTWKGFLMKKPWVMNYDRRLSPVAVEDVALALMRAVTSPIETAGKTYHLTGDIEARAGEWMQRVGDCVDVKEVAGTLQSLHPDWFLPFLKIIKEPQRKYTCPIIWNFFERMFWTYDEILRTKVDMVKPEYDEYGNPALTHEDLGIKPRNWFDREVILLQHFNPCRHWIYDGAEWVR